MAKAKQSTPLRRGWTTGACATAATKAALQGLVTGDSPAVVAITLPQGQQVEFAVAKHALTQSYAYAGVIKDAGDDPDVTHLALVESTVRKAAPGTGITFFAGTGVGTVTKPGLPIAPGEPAINPVPRQMIKTAIAELADIWPVPQDLDITLSIPGGAALAEKTWNPRLGIVGGLSILGTTGIVIPYSCAAWIHAIHRGVDVARQAGHCHLGAATGHVSETALLAYTGLPLEAMIDMGDFAGGLFKYLHRHPIAELSLAGGFAKLTKLAQGHLDLHSGRAQVDFDWLASECRALGAEPEVSAQIRSADSAAFVLMLAQQHDLAIANRIAAGAVKTTKEVIGQETRINVYVTNRDGEIVGEAHG